MVGHAEELADGRNMGFAVHAVEAFGDIEDEVGTGRHQLPGEIGIRLEADHLADTGEGLLDSIDGLGFVPLGVEVGLREIGAETAIARRRDAVGRCSWIGSGSCGLEVVSKPYSNRQKISLSRSLNSSLRSYTAVARSVRCDYCLLK